MTMGDGDGSHARQDHGKNVVSASTATAASATPAAASTPAPAIINTVNNNNNNAPGGLLGFFINRKNNKQADHTAAAVASSSGGATGDNNNKSNSSAAANSDRRFSRYQQMVHAGNSFYFGSGGAFIDDSDSDGDDNNAVTVRPTPTPVKISIIDAQDSSSSSAAAASSSSWMSQAWQSVDSATWEWMTATPSADIGIDKMKTDIINKNGNVNDDNGQSNFNLSWMAIPIPPSLSNMASNTLTSISSLNLNPFSDNTTDSSQLNNSSNNEQLSSSANNNSAFFLPQFASNFKWATRRQNPYQAVIGRSDADYLLSSSSTTYFGVWNDLLSSLNTSWLPWLTSINHGQLLSSVDNDGSGDGDGRSNGNGNHSSSSGSSSHSSSNANSLEEGKQRRHMLQQAMGRKKSQPSEASVQAVKNLLLLVQHQQQQQQQEEEESLREQQGKFNSEDDQRQSASSLDHPPLHTGQHQGNSKQRNSSPGSPPRSPKIKSVHGSPASLPSLSTPNDHPTTQQQQPPSSSTPKTLPAFPDLKEMDPRSFDSEPSFDMNMDPILKSPVRSAMARPSPSPRHPRDDDIMLRQHPESSASSPKPILRNNSNINKSSRDIDIGIGDGEHTNNGSSASGREPLFKNHQAMHAEMAARLAEGTLRAYRDLALDEATELHSALHHWTIRWERPFLGWLEAGPDVWFSEQGYSPYLAGKKVSQIQAVLARRCAVIGEIQQHLWRANWQKGVAEWGMLGGGVGGEWTSVVGELGGMDAPSSNNSASMTSSSTTSKKQQHNNPPAKKQKLMKIFNHSSFVGTNVSNSPGGRIVVDQEALTAWSIDAMRVIRDQLYRAIPASQGVRELPFVEHWPREKMHFRGEESVKGDSENTENTMDLPLWAQNVSSLASARPYDSSSAAAKASSTVDNLNSSSVAISDLNLMSEEVSAILQSIEAYLEQQRVRRLNRLRPPSRLRRNWYLVAIGVPVGAYVVYKLTEKHGGFFLIKTCISKVLDIYRDHVSEPLNSIYQELFTKSGRIDVTDRKALASTIESLKRMMHSWLEESFPKMSVEERVQQAETMDITLIEEKMEESIKHIYELNSVVRMSLIEMQFIKKELLSALVAMDELMGSNEINMQIAAMTPAIILLMAIRRTFQLLFYAIFQVGKSKEAIFSSFRQTILDIERLLVMRDNPPSPPDSLEWGSSRTASVNMAVNSTANSQRQQSRTLSADDLGMLLLHIHECRNILWQSRRRFQSDVLRNVSEDLAELAGERGPVSVPQQLYIISRMSRTYPFMKVLSSGLPLDMIIPGS